jgi:hypothetical protein
MAHLRMTIGSQRQFQIAVTKAGLAVDLTGIQTLTITLTTLTGQLFAQWGLGSGVVVSSPATLGLAVLTVTPAMLAQFTGPYYQTRYQWSLVDALGIPSLDVERGAFDFYAPPQGFAT